MKKLRNLYFLSFFMITLGCFYPCYGKNIDKALLSGWGVSNLSLKDIKCRDFNLPVTACVGNGECSKKGNQGLGVSKGNKEQHAVLLLLAHEVNAHGAKFCATQVQASRNIVGDKPWIRYYWPDGNQQQCFWVCSDGYGGEECEESNSSKVDSSILSQSTFSSLKLAVDSSINIMKIDETRYPPIASKIAFVYPDGEKLYCGPPITIKTEHNAFIGVVDYTPDGHGVITQAMVAHPSTSRAGNREVHIEVTTFGSERVLCKSGYKPSGESCVLTNPSTSGSGTTSGEAESSEADLICNGWDNTDFITNKNYKKYYPEGMDCYQFRCADESMGFTSLTDFTCIQCISSKQKGINTDGICITCEGNQMFDTETKRCREPVVVSTQELIYGKSGTPSANTDLDNQCWTKLESSDYVNCFEGSSKSSTGNDNI